MTEHDEPGKPALDADNPQQQEDDGEKGLGTETGAAGGPGGADQDVTKSIPESRGEVRYPDTEDPDEARPPAVPKEGHVDEDPDTTTDAAPGAKD
jgi:hypothetical protein